VIGMKWNLEFRIGKECMERNVYGIQDTALPMKATRKRRKKYLRKSM
jgi:hypothetical protein